MAALKAVGALAAQVKPVVVTVANKMVVLELLTEVVAVVVAAGPAVLMAVTAALESSYFDISFSKE